MDVRIYIYIYMHIYIDAYIYTYIYVSTHAGDDIFHYLLRLHHVLSTVHQKSPMFTVLKVLQKPNDPVRCKSPMFLSTVHQKSPMFQQYLHGKSHMF